MTRIDKNSLLHTLFSRTSKAAEQGTASKSQSSIKYSDTQLNFQERVQMD